MLWSDQKDVFEKMIENERNLLISKGAEYAGDQDCLANFKDADIVGMNPKQKLWVYLSKHMSSIASYIRHGKEFSNEPIEGRIADARNYLALLYMLIHEEKTTSPDKACQCKNSKK
jgi:hypothetical protein